MVAAATANYEIAKKGCCVNLVWEVVQKDTSAFQRRPLSLLVYLLMLEAFEARPLQTIITYMPIGMRED